MTGQLHMTGLLRPNRSPKNLASRSPGLLSQPASMHAHPRQADKARLLQSGAPSASQIALSPVAHFPHARGGAILGREVQFAAPDTLDDSTRPFAVVRTNCVSRMMKLPVSLFVLTQPSIAPFLPSIWTTQWGNYGRSSGSSTSTFFLLHFLIKDKPFK